MSTKHDEIFWARFALRAQRVEIYFGRLNRKKLLRLALYGICLSLLIPPSSFPLPGDSQSSQTQPAARKTSAASRAPSAQDIADAKAKGLVWVNLSTHVYHKDGSLYGATKRGKFMSEEDAKKAGFRQAQENGSGHKSRSSSATSK